MKKSILLITLLLLTCIIYSNTYTVTKTINNGSGSFRQAIIDVNASTDVTNTIVFNIPTSNGGYNSITGVFTITITSALPELRKSQVLIDGYSQITFAGNNNTATFRTATTVGTGVDGIEGTADDPVFPAINGAEIQIDANYTPRGDRKFVLVGDSNTVRGIAFLNLRLLFKGNSEGLLEQCTFGINAHSFADPGEPNRITNVITGAGSTTAEGCIELYDTTVNFVVRNNLFAYCNQRGIYVIDANWNYNMQLIENEIAFTNRSDGFNGGGIEFVPILRTTGLDTVSNRYLIRKALIARNNIHDCIITNTNFEFGIEFSIKDGDYNVPSTTSRLDSLLLENNTLYNSSANIVLQKLDQPSFGGIIRYNVIRNSRVGAGFVFNTTSNTILPQRYTVSKNSFYNNAQLGFDLKPDTHPLGSSIVNFNDVGDVDTGPNDKLNFPIIWGSDYTTGSNLELWGTAPAGAIIEVYLADNNTAFSPLYATSPQSIPSFFTSPLGISGYGEGKKLLATFTEGDVNDLDAGTLSYIDDGTGAIATRTENRWRIIVPSTSLPAGFDLLWRLTSTATDANGNTSEFGPSPTLLILPFEKLGFTAKLAGKNTATLNCVFPNNHIGTAVIEHSVDAINWLPITTAISTTQITFTYNHTITAVNNYYRLKLISSTNDIKYSAIQLVKTDKAFSANQLQVFPNPSNGQFGISIPADFEKQQCQLEIFDSNGRIVVTNTTKLANNQWLQLNVAKGVYNISLKNIKTQKTISTKILIQ